MTQFIAASDTFDENPVHYGLHFASYMRYQPWTTDAGSGYAIPTAPTFDLHSGYAPPAAFKSATANVLCGCLWRAYYNANARSSLAFTLDTVAGVAGPDTFRYAGVIGRMSGAPTYNDAQAGGQRMIGGDCYIFMLANDAAHNSGGFSTYLLLRVNGGVPVILASQAGPLASTLPFALGTSTELAMAIVNAGSVPQITCLVNGNGVIFQNDLGGPGVAITAAGRWGFVMCRDRQEAGPINSVTLSQYFQIVDIATTATVHRDEWHRSYITEANQMTADGNGITLGRDLMCMYGGDVHSNAGTHADRDPGNDRIVETNNGGSDFHAYHLRDATNANLSRRSMLFHLTGSITTTTYFGIFLRGSDGTSVSYALFVRGTLTQPLTLILCRDSGGQGTSSVIASWDISALFSVPGDCTLDMQVYNDGLGRPTITARMNGNTPTWTPGTVTGFLFPAGGDVIDNNGFGAINSGLVEGFFSQRFNTAVSIFMDTWLDLPVVVPQGQTHVSQSLLEGFARIGIKPADAIFVPEARMSQSYLEGFAGGVIEARVSQSLLEGFYGTFVAEARVSQALLEGFYDQAPNVAGLPEDACIAIGATGPGSERVSAAGPGLQRLGASGPGVERLRARGAGVQAIGASGPGVERIGVRCP